MDMFICDNFFNKKLDVAYVIDPCRGDRAMFQWTGNPSQRVKRQGGFFVTASRFREAELEHYVGELSGQMPVTTTSQRSAPGGYSAPVVHLHQPQAPPPPPWQGLAIAGALAMQFLLVALIAWKTLVPDAAGPGEEEVAAALADLKEAQQELAIAEARLQSQRETMDRAVAALAPGESFTELQRKVDQAARLERDVQARENEYLKLQDTLTEAGDELKSSKAAQDRLNDKIKALETDKEKLAESLKTTQDKLAVYEPPTKAAGDKSDETTGGDNAISIWWWVGGGVLAAVALVAGVWWMGERLNKDEGDQTADTENESKRSEVKKDGDSAAGN
jgi:hypothetical protein